MTRLLNTPIIGPSAKTVASSWIDMLAGLSGLYILRIPPGFCAHAAPPVVAASSTAPAIAITRDCRCITVSSRCSRPLRPIEETRGGTLVLVRAPASGRLAWAGSKGQPAPPLASPLPPPWSFGYPDGPIAEEHPQVKAILCREWGGPDTLRFDEVERAPLRPNEARIRVHACGVNFADTLMIAGKYQVKPEFPFTPGLEAAGVVVETGVEVTHLRPEQRVLAVLRFGGGYAEEIVLNADAIVPIPDAMDFVTAAAFPVAYGTAHFALTHRGHLQPGETLLVLGAAGGVGLSAVEIGKEHGADELIDYQRESIRDRMRDLTGELGADVVFDPVGGDAFDQALRAVNWEARMLVIGFAAGRIQAVPANLILVKNISVIGVVWGAQAARDPILVSRNLAELLRWWEAGRLNPLVAKTFPLAEAGAAMHDLLSRRHAGKIVLET